MNPEKLDKRKAKLLFYPTESLVIQPRKKKNKRNPLIRIFTKKQKKEEENSVQERKRKNKK